MEWADYYERFYDWAESTRISRISGLTDFDSSSEVFEIAQEFSDDNTGTPSSAAISSMWLSPNTFSSFPQSGHFT